MKGKERTTNSGLCHTIVFILIIVIIKILVILSFYVSFEQTLAGLVRTHFSLPASRVRSLD